MDADGVEISKPGESSHSVAAKDVKITTTTDTLVKAMFLLHNDGEEACISMFPRGSRFALMLLNALKSETVGHAVVNHDKETVGKELLKVKKFEIDLWYETGLETEEKEKIQDVSPLAGLVNLTWLDLHGNKIVDITPLADLVNLETLWLAYNQIVDVSPLAGLFDKLTRLDLRNNKIVDVAPLAGLWPCPRHFEKNI